MKNMSSILFVILFIFTLCSENGITERPPVNSESDEPKKPPVSNVLWIAASNSSSADKVQADYICDGINDQQEIQSALNKLPSSGGVINLHSGTYHCAG